MWSVNYRCLLRNWLRFCCCCASSTANSKNMNKISTSYLIWYHDARREYLKYRTIFFPFFSEKRSDDEPLKWNSNVKFHDFTFNIDFDSFGAPKEIRKSCGFFSLENVFNGICTLIYTSMVNTYYFVMDGKAEFCLYGFTVIALSCRIFSGKAHVRTLASI